MTNILWVRYKNNYGILLYQDNHCGLIKFTNKQCSWISLQDLVIVSIEDVCIHILSMEI